MDCLPLSFSKAASWRRLYEEKENRIYHSSPSASMMSMKETKPHLLSSLLTLLVSVCISAETCAEWSRESLFTFTSLLNLVHPGGKFPPLSSLVSP